MLKLCLSLYLAAASFAQQPPAASEPDKVPPPKVDAALRARVSQFYQYEVEHQFRKAEGLVAKDTKDFFVGSQKPFFLRFNIRSIQYSDDFKTAKVWVNVERMVPVEGFIGHALPGVLPSQWKVEKGKWCWYEIPGEFKRTPFGPLSGPPGVGFDGGLSSSSPTLPGRTPVANSRLPEMPNISAITSALRPDKSSLVLKPGAPSSDQLTISNPTTRPLTLSLTDPKIAGLSVSLDRTNLGPGAKCVLAVQSTGTPTPGPVTVVVRVQETNQVIPIRVSFASPAK
jgi:hypothetical protein